MVEEEKHVEALRVAIEGLIEEPKRSGAWVGRKILAEKLGGTEGKTKTAVIRQVQRILAGDTRPKDWDIVEAMAVVCGKPERIGELARLYVKALPTRAGADRARDLAQESVAMVTVAPVPSVPELASAGPPPPPPDASDRVHTAAEPELDWWRLGGRRLDYFFCLLGITCLATMIAMAVVNVFPVAWTLVGVAAATPLLGVFAPYPWSTPLIAVGLIDSASGLIIFSNGLNGTYLTYLLLSFALALYDEWWLGLLATAVVGASILVIPHLLTVDRDGPLSWALLFAAFPAVVAFAQYVDTQRAGPVSERDDEDGDSRDGPVAAPTAKPAPTVAPPEPEPAQAEPYNGRHLYVVEELRSMS
jgi:hypothetical protein